MSTEAGTWRESHPQGLYRQTWFSVSTNLADTVNVTVRVRFSDDLTRTHTRNIVVGSVNPRVAFPLDEFRIPIRADATIDVECDGACWPATAIYYAPLARGVTPAITPIPMECRN